MTPPTPVSRPLPVGPIYPLQSAITRNRVLHYACQLAVNTAMRRLHGVPADIPNLADFPDDVAQQITDAYLAESAHRYHQRMKVDARSCRWCGVAADEARAELEDDE